ncbi:MAG: tetratricopeptide repeat protein [Candidatus Wallbacteria bacterium]|nr:tetratricopeptide repeat protein [Candidatus Wallbacteria bacterium]
MNIKLLLAAITFLAFIAPAFAATDKDFLEGVRFYQNKEYEKSASAFLKASEAVINPDVYFNLANAYFKSGQLGKAILYYEKSLMLAYDQDCRRNLDFAVSRTEDRIEHKKTLVSSWLHRIGPDRLFTAASWSAFLSGLFFSLKILGRRIHVIAAALPLLLALLLFTASSYGYYEMHLPRAVILAHEVPVLVAPGIDESVSFKLHEGARVMVLEDRGAWLRISLPNGLSGWLPSEHTGRV